MGYYEQVPFILFYLNNSHVMLVSYSMVPYYDFIIIYILRIENILIDILVISYLFILYSRYIYKML